MQAEQQKRRCVAHRAPYDTVLNNSSVPSDSVQYKAVRVLIKVRLFVEDHMNEHYLVDTHGHTIGVVVDPDTYRALVQARAELERVRAAQASRPSSNEAPRKQHSIRELRGLGKEIWAGVDVQTYIKAERDAWDG